MINIQHVRDGKSLSYRWGHWHLARLWDVICMEKWGHTLHTLPRLYSPMSITTHHVRGEYVFEDGSDGEIMIVRPGDVIYQHG